MPVTSVGDARHQKDAYLTDGKKLYQVLDAHTVTPAYKRPELRVWLEDSCSGLVVEVDATFSGMRLRLVERECSAT